MQAAAFALAMAWLVAVVVGSNARRRRRSAYVLAAFAAFGAFGFLRAASPDVGFGTYLIANLSLYLVRPVAVGWAVDRRALALAAAWTATLVALLRGVHALVHFLLGIDTAIVVPLDIVLLAVVLLLVPLLAPWIHRAVARVELIADWSLGHDRARLLIRFVQAAQRVAAPPFDGLTREEIEAGTGIRARHVGIVAKTARKRLAGHAPPDPSDPLMEEFEEPSVRVRKRYRLTPAGLQAASRLLGEE